MGMDAIALTDHDGMYGAVRFSLACREAGVRPILGAEVEWGDGFHAVLLAQNAIGWSNLCRLVTEMHLNERAQSLTPGKRPRTTFDSIARHSQGVFALSGCTRGEVAWYAELGRIEEANAAARRWRDVFEDRYAIELSNHLLPGDALRNRRLFELARLINSRTVATNNVHYVTTQDSVMHDVADCIRRTVGLSAATAPRKNSEYWLKPTDQMCELHPQEAIDGSRFVAEQCRFELPFGSFHFPEMGANSTSVLAKRCWDGLQRRNRVVTKATEERLQMELRMIRRGGFCGYFMVVADIVAHAKHVLGIRCACRGSAAGSLVAYALDISDVDPIAYDLVFERFMNEHRVEIPDIDVDFESARREEMNAYILETYGNATAMVAMMETYRARGALREVGKALGINPSEVDTVAKAFPHVSAKQIPEALESLPEVASLGLKASRFEMLFDLAARMDGFPRHLAMHPSGVILSDSNLADLMPMQRSFNGYLMSQFDKDDVEALGLAKLDVLGVRMFSSMAFTLQQIEAQTGERIDLGAIPRDDARTFELIRDSRTLGCFQIESPGQRELLGKFQPTTFEDLIIDISLFRPGPMKADMIKPFLNRRMGLEYASYPHPSLRPILSETNGVIVYHEQVMRVISALTGCDLGEADKIRRNLDCATDVIEKAKERGWEPAAAAKVWAEVLSFASFGFCKAHAAAFAVPTYQSAWLKVHHPAEFYCGVLTHDPGMYPRRAILADARAHGVPILPVDVNHSMQQYVPQTCENSVGIRLGLMDVKGISTADIEAIVEGRPWRGFDDFMARAQVNRPVVEALAHCGAFDGVKGRRSRRELLWLTHDGPSTSKQASDQLSLDIYADDQLQLPGIAEYTDREKVQAELEVIGLDASRHLISFYHEQLRRAGWTPASKLTSLRARTKVVVAGVKVATQTPPTRSGRRVVFVSLDDGTGQADVTLFEDVQGRFARVVFDGWILAVKGTLRRTGAKGVSVLAEEVIDLARDIETPKLWYSSPGSAGR